MATCSCCSGLGYQVAQPPGSPAYRTPCPICAETGQIRQCDACEGTGRDAVGNTCIDCQGCGLVPEVTP